MLAIMIMAAVAAGEQAGLGLAPVYQLLPELITPLQLALAAQAAQDLESKVFLALILCSVQLLQLVVVVLQVHQVAHLQQAGLAQAAQVFRGFKLERLETRLALPHHKVITAETRLMVAVGVVEQAQLGKPLNQRQQVVRAVPDQRHLFLAAA